ncbi:MAG: kinesin-like protein Klp5 [Sclerophora amabilis]|nr:MAG: kinesin-like protein Klp5 [Sclerophora amabilis]
MAAAGGASSISVTGTVSAHKSTLSSDSLLINSKVRVRPFTIREAAQLTKCDDGPFFLGDGSLAGVPTPKLMQKGIRPVVKVVDDKCLVFDPPEDNPIQRFSRSVVPSSGKKVKDQTFGFDRVFDENTSQGDVYDSTTRNLLDSVLDGFNATVFAYGATGCGKTHTITGTHQQPGIIFLTMQELFERIGEQSGEKETEISLSYLEIYNETIRDLLVPGGSKGGLMLREDANQAVSVAGLSSHHPQNVQEVMDMIVKGNEYRTMSPTEANATSSRSHAVLQINVAQKDRNADVNEPHTMATLSIIDLAGSERASATKNRGERLLEGANINKSLLALGSCINALCDPRKKNHVPYRNSKLTRLLKFSLGGNCKTVMIVCVSPSSHHFDETQNTLRYANRAKNIQTKVTRNVYNVNRHVKDFLKKIDEQMALINELKQQQKDYETTAFAKFKKQDGKKEAITNEGIARLRNAYEHSVSERQEKMNNMKKLKQIERRIAAISSWVAAFDGICDTRDDEEPAPHLLNLRKTAQGILVELEGSRQHYHQRLAKASWTRAIDSALQTGIRQLHDVDGGNDGADIAILTREADLLKANTERDALSGVLEQEKGGETAVMQSLLYAHFETIASVRQVLQMDEATAVFKARGILSKVSNSCSDITSVVIKPDSGLIANEAFPPTRNGTPKRRKQMNLLGPSPLKPLNLPEIAISPSVSVSPAKASPKRRKAGLARKGVSFTPKKKSPGKRAVRWRDDTENGTLAEFEKTPKKAETTPEIAAVELEQPALAIPPHLCQDQTPSDSNDSSPIPAPPEPTLDLRPKSDRFKTGFLAKRSDGSPVPPSLTALSSSDSERSPLQDLEPKKGSNRSSLQAVQLATSDVTSNESGSNSSSDTEQGTPWRADRKDAMSIKSAIKRASMANNNAAGSSSNNRNQRRRSPGGAGSPPTENQLFTASHARRMVKSDKENNSHGNVLSPWTAPVMKNGRRTTIGESKATTGMSGREAARLSMVGSGGGRANRDSSIMSSGGKTVWR